MGMIPQEMIDKAVKEVDDKVGKKRPKDELDQLREWASENCDYDTEVGTETIGVNDLIAKIRRLKEARGKI